MTREINGLRFVQTCSAFPEQYDVFRGDEQVGYIRLRYGHLWAHVPDGGGACVLDVDLDDAWECFANEEQRSEYLHKIANLINE